MFSLAKWQIVTSLTSCRRITLRMDAPDIILVNDIEDLNTDAILLNAQLNIVILQQPDKLNLRETSENN